MTSSPMPSVAATSALILDTFNEDVLQARVDGMRLALGGPADLVLVFLTPQWLPKLPEFLEITQIGLRCGRLVGCTAGALVSSSGEHEERAGCSLLALRLAGDTPRIERWAKTPAAWPAHPGPSHGAIVLGHPLQLPVDGWMESWRHHYPDLPSFGGLASGGAHAGHLKLFDQDGEFDGALLAVHFTGRVRLDGVVAQSCRPMGFPYVVTGAEGNILTSLGGESPMRRLEEALQQFQKNNELTAPMAPGLIHAGFPASERQAGSSDDDVVVRAIIGADPNSGAMALAGLPRVGQTLQFQMRDPESADEAWRAACRRLKGRLPSLPLAALLFPCLGRGQAFFGLPDHDSGVFAEELGALPVAGAFVNGELAITGGRMHAHTFSVAGVIIRVLEAPAP